MYISPLQYIELTDRIELLKKQCSGTHEENVKLRQIICKQEQEINYLSTKLQQQEKQQENNHEEIIQHVTNTSQNVKNLIGMTAEEQKMFIEQQVEKIKADVNVKKVKELEKKMTQNRMKNHQMVDFYQKVKTLYHSWTKKKKQPTTTQLYKWVSDRKIDVAETISNQSFITRTENSFMSKVNRSKFGKKLNNSIKNSKKNNENKENKSPNNKITKQKKISSFLPIVEENERQSSHCDFASQILSKGSLLEQAKKSEPLLFSEQQIDDIKMDEADSEIIDERPNIMENSNIKIIV